VAFACGAVVENSGEIKVYYGAADTCVCVATTDFNELVAITLAGKSS
jgi:beta-1,4-mannooligosaccharide/beta-1,4-mannosyl-N-acetylglucosamine phosphorylase